MIKKTAANFLQSKTLLFCVVVLLVVKIAAIAVSFNFPANIFFADITKIALLNFVNQSRQEQGVAPLTENAKLDSAAYLKAQDMVSKGYFSHESPEGITPWYWLKNIGYAYKYAGENLAVGFFDSYDVYNAWMNSPSHKNNLLNPNYKEIGTAVVDGFGQNNAIVVVQFFGALAGQKSAADNAGKAAAPTKASDNAGKTSLEPEKEVKQEQEQPPVQPEGAKDTVRIAGKEVLSQYAESGNDAFYLRALNLLSYDYERFLQYAIYCLLTAIIIALFCWIVSAGLEAEPTALFRSVLLLAILLSAALLNKEAMYLIIRPSIII